jgi:hypothetical protein
MAVLQISKIQVRRGQESQTGVPSLSSGEFAWSIDAQRLYIGNGSVSEGAPQIGVTRILTELDTSNIFQLAGTYAYQGNSGSTIITGSSPNTPVSRTLQDKLDDFVTLADFGADPTGYADTTAIMQQAIDQLYLNSDKSLPVSRVTLKIPAGTYLVTGTVYIPPNATIQGAGIDKTVIVQSTQNTIFQTCGGDSTPGVHTVYPNLPSSSNQPRNVGLTGMTLKFLNNTLNAGNIGMINVDCLHESYIKEIKFDGGSISTAALATAAYGINIRGQGANTTENLYVENCYFNNLQVGINAVYDSYNLSISKNIFNSVQEGININPWPANGIDLTTQSVGPKFVNVRDNKFNTTLYQAIWVATNTNNISNLVVSSNNIYNDCGNGADPSTDGAQVTEAVGFYTPGNRSTNDYFSRDVANSTGTPNPMIPAIKGHAYVESNKTTYPLVALPVQAFPTNVLTLALTNYSEQVKIDYTATQPSLGVTRVGQVQVLVGVNTATVYDTFQYTGANSLTGDIQWSASVNTTTNALAIGVTNPIGSVATSLTFHYTQLF